MTLASRRGDGVVSAEVLCFPTPASRAPLAPRLPFLDRRAERIEMPVIKVNNSQYPLHRGQNRIGSGAHAHGDKADISARELSYSDDTTSGNMPFVSSCTHAVAAFDGAAVAFFLLNR